MKAAASQITNQSTVVVFLNSLFGLNKKVSKFRIIGPLWEESTGHRWIPLTKGQQGVKRSHVVTMFTCTLQAQQRRQNGSALLELYARNPNDSWFLHTESQWCEKGPHEMFYHWKN